MKRRRFRFELDDGRKISAAVGETVAIREISVDEDGRTIHDCGVYICEPSGILHPVEVADETWGWCPVCGYYVDDKERG